MGSIQSVCYVFSFSVDSPGSPGTRYSHGMLGFWEATLSPPTSYLGAGAYISLARFSLQSANPHPVRVSRDALCKYRHSARRVQLIGNRGDRWKSVRFKHQTVPLYESLPFCNLSVSKYFSLDFHCMRSFVRNSVWIVKWCLYTVDSPFSGRNQVRFCPDTKSYIRSGLARRAGDRLGL